MARATVCNVMQMGSVLVHEFQPCARMARLSVTLSDTSEFFCRETEHSMPFLQLIYANIVDPYGSCTMNICNCI